MILNWTQMYPLVMRQNQALCEKTVMGQNLMNILFDSFRHF